MVVGRGKWLLGKQMKTEGVGKKIKKQGKGEKEKGEKGPKNAYLRVKNSKKFAGGQPPHRVGEKNYVLFGENDQNV